jgi:hypothetical protein
VLSFHPLLVDGKWFDESSATGNKNFDFGVRAIALTG